jgi:hypothetical protein
MNMGLGNKYLISTDDWFYGPDGQQYKAVFGTVTGVRSDEEALGIKTNRHATNWYIEIGNMIIVGCQVHYVTRTDRCEKRRTVLEVENNGKVELCDATQRIYFADEE